MSFKDLELSKTMSYALRHNYQQFNLQLDGQGFTSINDLVTGIRNNGSKFQNVTVNDIFRIVDTDSKKRYEIVGDKIRAVYGHSIEEKIEKQSSQPPTILYHGTTLESSKKILEIGLNPMARQYVHLSADIETAFLVGSRRTKNPIILVVNAEDAYKDGIHFYAEPNNIYLSDSIPAKYISY